MSKLFVVIMAGGVGARFWPLSTPENPKQCLQLISQQSLLKNCLIRALQLVPMQQIIVVTGAAMLSRVAEQVAGVPKDNIIVEPSPRNTAPCIALALRMIVEKGGERLLVWPCDHHINSTEDWLSVSKEALKKCSVSGLSLIGISATHPATNYGYIARDDKDKGQHNI